MHIGRMWGDVSTCVSFPANSSTSPHSLESICLRGLPIPPPQHTPTLSQSPCSGSIGVHRDFLLCDRASPGPRASGTHTLRLSSQWHAFPSVLSKPTVRASRGLSRVPVTQFSPRGRCHLDDTIRLHNTLPGWSLGWSPVQRRKEEFTKDQPKLNCTEKLGWPSIVLSLRFLICST